MYKRIFNYTLGNNFGTLNEEVYFPKIIVYGFALYLRKYINFMVLTNHENFCNNDSYLFVINRYNYHYYYY